MVVSKGMKNYLNQDPLKANKKEKFQSYYYRSKY